MKALSTSPNSYKQKNKPPSQVSVSVVDSSYRKGRGWCCQKLSIRCTLLHRGRRRGTIYCYSATYEGSETLSKGGYLCKAHPPHSSVTGVRGRGEGGVYTTSNARGRGEGAGGRTEGSSMKGGPYHLQPTPYPRRSRRTRTNSRLAY